MIIRIYIPKFIFITHAGHEQPIEKRFAEVSPVKFVAELVKILP
jgi:hypothetical protein